MRIKLFVQGKEIVLIKFIYASACLAQMCVLSIFFLLAACV